MDKTTLSLIKSNVQEQTSVNKMGFCNRGNIFERPKVKNYLKGLPLDSAVLIAEDIPSGQGGKSIKIATCATKLGFCIKKHKEALVLFLQRVFYITKTFGSTYKVKAMVVFKLF
jgi:hypothetical protein